MAVLSLEGTPDTARTAASFALPTSVYNLPVKLGKCVIFHYAGSGGEFPTAPEWWAPRMGVKDTSP